MTFVIVFAELVISLFRNLIPNSVRIPTFIIVIAAFTTMIDLIMKAYFPELSKAMGVFIPLIVVNCIIMGRVEAFASKEKPLDAVVDALGMGLGYTWVLVGIAAFRELLGNGTILRRPDHAGNLSAHPLLHPAARRLPGVRPLHLLQHLAQEDHGRNVPSGASAKEAA
ncbi:MAG: hypothetical protein MZV70_35070 [Desulfobacterales bacterium]|nr:hypothetical protein [Desulfobacterales bacterium]